jgi:hypothetical protein
MPDACAVRHLPGERCAYPQSDPDPLGHAIAHAVTFAIADAIDECEPDAVRDAFLTILTAPTAGHVDR